MPKNNCNKKMMAGLFSILLSHGAQATIIDHGTYLTDTVSGIDWLDVTASVNMSVNQVSSQFGAGGLFEGWRYASGDEFNQLVGNYTGNAVTSNDSSRYYQQIIQEPDLIDGLVYYLGSTFDSNWKTIFGKTWDEYFGYSEGAGYDYTKGYIADTLGGLPYVAMLLDYDINASTPDFSVARYSLYTGDNQGDTGSYLVRNTQTVQIPEPSTITLLGLGLFAFAGSRNKHRF